MFRRCLEFSVAFVLGLTFALPVLAGGLTIKNVEPVVEATGYVLGPMEPASALGGSGAQPLTSSIKAYNWSGRVLAAPVGTFTTNFSQVYAQWLVPRAGLPVGSSVDADNDVVVMVGFDGGNNTSSDVLEAGTLSVEFFNGGSVPTIQYNFWFGWYPRGLSVVSNLPVTAGDFVAANVWYTTKPPHGHAYLVNYSQQVSTIIDFDEPAAAHYQGNTVEWIAERLIRGFGVADNLSNYMVLPMNQAYAEARDAHSNEQIYWANGLKAGTSLTNVTMVCPPWEPSSVCTVAPTTISSASVTGLGTLWFSDAGPALGNAIPGS